MEIIFEQDCLFHGESLIYPQVSSSSKRNLISLLNTTSIINTQYFMITQSTFDHQSSSFETVNDQIFKLKQFLSSYRPHSKIDFSSLVNEPNFRMKSFKQGDYYGQLKGPFRHGLGILIYHDSRVYEGRYSQDRKEGQGFLLYPNKAQYEGEFHNGLRQGKGRYTWPNGEIYDGEWFEDKKHGSGLWKSLKGDQYIGQWNQGLACGYGVHVWINGDRYEGQFEKGLKHGQGIEKFANGDIYEGEYQFGKPHGKGTYIWANGNVYKGDFQDGVRHGIGVWKTVDGKEGYEGAFVQDRKEGEGKYFWSNGNQFTGEFQNDKRHGNGVLVLPNNQTIKGRWINGKMIQDKMLKSYDDTYRNRQTMNTICRQILKLQTAPYIKSTTDMVLKKPQPINAGQSLFDGSNLNENENLKETIVQLPKQNRKFPLTRKQYQSLDASTPSRYPSSRNNSQSKASEASTSIDSKAIKHRTKEQEDLLPRLTLKKITFTNFQKHRTRI